ALLLAQEAPALLADRELARSFNRSVAAREIEAALAADDVDLAKSFLDLAADRNVAVDPDLAGRVQAGSSGVATAVRTASKFGHGFVTGEPDDLVGLAGTAVGGLFVFGGIRDAVREGAPPPRGEQRAEHIPRPPAPCPPPP